MKLIRTAFNFSLTTGVCVHVATHRDEVSSIDPATTVHASPHVAEEMANREIELSQGAAMQPSGVASLETVRSDYGATPEGFIRITDSDWNTSGDQVLSVRLQDMHNA
jgi:hypothetical protein